MTSLQSQWIAEDIIRNVAVLKARGVLDDYSAESVAKIMGTVLLASHEKEIQQETRPEEDAGAASEVTDAA